MKPKSLSLLLCGLAITPLLGACSNAALQDRMDRRSGAYSSFQERREIRQDARDQRYDAWWDRVMH